MKLGSDVIRSREEQVVSYKCALHKVFAEYIKESLKQNESKTRQTPSPTQIIRLYRTGFQFVVGWMMTLPQIGPRPNPQSL